MISNEREDEGYEVPTLTLFGTEIPKELTQQQADGIDELIEVYEKTIVATRLQFARKLNLILEGRKIITKNKDREIILST